MKKGVLPIYRMMPRVKVLVDELPIWGTLKPVAVLWLCVELTNAYSMFKAYVWYASVGMNFFLPHVKFEGRLPISVLRGEAARNKKFELQIEKFLKKENVFQTPPAPPSDPMHQKDPMREIRQKGWYAWKHTVK
ncbi:hypothetical protein [Absidia glauca]|uniref:Uncharacterized protein n=1 Tax=Absidia glauca TaxID=4829 RepID=A0A163K1D9_ABSGL|nr:hypothetical protein [Absidia glauca]